MSKGVMFNEIPVVNYEGQQSATRLSVDVTGSLSDQTQGLYECGDDARERLFAASAFLCSLLEVKDRMVAENEVSQLVLRATEVAAAFVDGSSPDEDDPLLAMCLGFEEEVPEYRFGPTGNKGLTALNIFAFADYFTSLAKTTGKENLLLPTANGAVPTGLVLKQALAGLGCDVEMFPFRYSHQKRGDVSPRLSQDELAYLTALAETRNLVVLEEDTYTCSTVTNVLAYFRRHLRLPPEALVGVTGSYGGRAGEHREFRMTDIGLRSQPISQIEAA